MTSNCGGQLRQAAYTAAGSLVSPVDREQEKIYNETKENRGYGMAVASLVLGILSILIVLFGFGSYWWLAPVFGIIGIILGVQGKKDHEKRGLAQAGFICSIWSSRSGRSNYRTNRRYWKHNRIGSVI